MNIDKRIADQTRDEILNMLSDQETRTVSLAEDGQVSPGEEYVDLEHLERGVQHAKSETPAAHLLPRTAVAPSTWARILRALTPIRIA